MYEWDFHEERKDWMYQFDFIYTNSLDQAWKPFQAISTWLNQLKENGLLFIEHTRYHGVSGSSEMDPFGVLPEFMPYLLIDHFGMSINIEIIKSVKLTKATTLKDPFDVWIFVLRKNRVQT